MTSRRLFLQASLSALLAPRLARSAESGSLVCRPYVQNIRKTRAVIRWVTLQPGRAEVSLIPPDGGARIIAASSSPVSVGASGLAPRFRHEAIVTGLAPGTDYGYQVMLDSNNLALDGLAFRTAGAQAFDFLAVGDTGFGSEEQGALAARMREERPRLVIHTGDVAYPSGQYEYYERHYFDYYHAIMRQVPFYPTPGNHDYYETGAQPYFAVHDLPAETVPEGERGRFYTFEWANAQFFSLDSNDTLEAAVSGKSGMLQWLAAQLETSQKFWRVVFFHHPPYAGGAHHDDPLCELVRRHVTPILERYAVPLAFCGHEHSYQRSHPQNGVTYITTGGGGAPLHEVLPAPYTALGQSVYHYVRGHVDGVQMTLRAIGLDGREFDSLMLRPAPVLGLEPVVNAASFVPAIGRGSLITVLGWQMAADVRDNSGRAIADADCDVRVRLGGRPLPLLMISPNQVNAALPEDFLGRGSLEVSTAAGSVFADIEVVPVAPGLFADSFVAVDEKTMQVFATGLDGVTDAVQVRVGASSVAGRAAAGQLPGLQTVRFEIPSRLEPGVWPVSVEAGGIRSNTVPMSL